MTLLPGIGDIIGKKLISYCGGVEAVFREKKQALQKIPGIGNTLVDAILNQNVLGRAEEEIVFIEKYKIQHFFYLDENYPDRLKHCIDSPMMLYFKGNADLNAAKVVSVVGSRTATEYGKDYCRKIIEGFAGQDILITSGLAYGIDTCAHKSALDNGLSTVGVMAHGLDRIYPYLNKKLAKRMLDNGGLLTEFMSNTNPDRENFPKRNRIIAGIADVTIVVESRKRGGALITAEIANSYNRDVFAVPGRLEDELSEGCNYLLKINKAALVQSADDIIYIMGWEKSDKKQIPKQGKLFVNFSEDEELLVKLLKENGESGIDWLCANANLNMSKLAAALLNLEFEGVVNSLPGKVYKLI